MKDRFYVKVFLNGLRTHIYYDNLTLAEAQFKQMEEKRKGRSARILKHKTVEKKY